MESFTDNFISSLKKKIGFIINYLGSYKFSIIILSIIAIVALIGSLIPQGGADAQLQTITDIFGSNAMAVHQFLFNYGLFNIYESKFFMVLLLLFAINLILCTFKLLPFMFNGYLDKPIQFTDSVETTATADEIKEFFKHDKWLGSIYNTDFYKAEKHRGGRKGVIILHAGVLLVLLGALIGYTLGLKGYINILEGTGDNVAMKKDGSFEQYPFEVFVNRFDIDYYDNTSRPKSFKADISILSDNKTLKRQTIDVNHPLRYGGYTFYQTSYGFYPNKDMKLLLSKTYDNATDNITVRLDESFKVSANIIAKVYDFAPALAVKGDESYLNVSEDMINPAILVEFYDREGEPLFRGWVFGNNKASGDFVKDFGFKLEFDKAYGIQYTGISVKKDNGTIVVYIGFILVVFGLLFIYLLNYTAIFFTIEDKGDRRIIRYLVRKQRKHSLADPISSFFKYISR